MDALRMIFRRNRDAATGDLDRSLTVRVSNLGKPCVRAYERICGNGRIEIAASNHVRARQIARRQISDGAHSSRYA